MIDFVTAPPIENPHRVGKELRDELAGIWSARRGTYRILYRINERDREVIVLRIDHRRDAYRGGAWRFSLRCPQTIELDPREALITA